MKSVQLYIREINNVLCPMFDNGLLITLIFSPGLVSVLFLY